MRSVAVILLLVLSLVCAASAGDLRNETDYSQAPWSLRFHGAEYDVRADITTFRYSVRVDRRGPDLLHLVVSGSGCETASLASGRSSGWSDYEFDPATGVSGWRFSSGQEADSNRTYSLSLRGFAALTDVRFALAGGRDFAQSWTAGPNCGVRPPSDSDFPRDKDLKCDDAELGATDGFESESRLDGPCRGDYTLLRRYSRQISDGLRSTYEQHINVRDTRDPFFNDTEVPRDLHLKCNSTLPSAASVRAYDNCDRSPRVEFNEDTTRGSCPFEYFVTRSWTAIDHCGNSVCHTQTISVVDDVAPELSAYPASLTVECPANSSALDVPTVTVRDNCDADARLDFREERVEGPCRGTYRLIRTWTASDSCGNNRTHTQVVEVVDTRKPLIKLPPEFNATLTVECGEEPTPFKLTAFDECSGQLRVRLHEYRSPGRCPQEQLLTRVYSARDECGNEESVVQRITIRDTRPPVFVTDLPRLQVAECTALPRPEKPVVQDACDSNGTRVELEEQRFCNSSRCCNSDYQLHWIWTATDSCGNRAVFRQVIDVIDTTPPRINASTVPPSVDVSCDRVPPMRRDARLLPFPNNTCDPRDERIDSEERRVPGACPYNYTLVRTYTAVDCVNNTDTAVQVVHVSDSRAPEILRRPNDTVAECHLPAAERLIAEDDCSPRVSVSVRDETLSRQGDGCFSVLRTYESEDDCGNRRAHEQRIDVRDTQRPFFLEFPSNFNATCRDNVSAPIPPAAFDDCVGRNVSVVLLSEDKIPGRCPAQYRLNRTWAVFDQCGNSVVRSQIIFFDDRVPPVFERELRDITTFCDRIPAEETLTARDDCGPADVSFEVRRINGTCGQNFILERKWTATDACGNTASQVQRVFVSDGLAPRLHNADGGDLPRDKHVTCFEEGQPATLKGEDNCDPRPRVTFEERRVNGSCPGNYTLFRTWTAIDDCGNSAFHTQVVTANDDRPPVVSAPDNINGLECGKDSLPAPGRIAVFDKCSTERALNNSIHFVESIVDQHACGFTVLRQWTVEDECRNRAVASQNITVLDTQPPIFRRPLPEDLHVSCDRIPSRDFLEADDGCTSATVTFQEEKLNTTGCPNEFLLRRTWTATDRCGNKAYHVQKVTVSDSEAPRIEGAPRDNLRVRCDAIPTAPDVHANDRCGRAVVELRETHSNGSCPQNRTLTRTWVASDACGNTNVSSHTIEVYDNVPPVWAERLPPRIIDVECTARDLDLHVPQPPRGSDSCGRAHVQTLVHEVQNRSCPHNVDLELTFVNCDECSNCIRANSTLRVRDTQPPRFGFPEGRPKGFEVARCFEPAVPEVNVTDACDANAASRFTSQTRRTSCPYEFVVERSWVATDACGNRDVFNQTVQVVYDDSPRFTGRLPNSTLQVGCKDRVPVANLTAVDGCGADISDHIVLSIGRTILREGCLEEETRIWTVTDVCNKSATFTQTIIYADEQPPRFNDTPRDIDLFNECRPRPAANLSAVDDCDSSRIAVSVRTRELNRTCPYVFAHRHTWVASDRCGNVATHYHDIHYRWTLPPVLQFHNSSSEMPPSRLQIECNETLPGAPRLFARDGCGREVDVRFSEYVRNGSCPNNFDIVREWVAIDECGLSNNFTQVVEVRDTIPPRLWGVPADTLVECRSIPEPALVNATDHCPGVRLQFYEERFNGSADDRNYSCNYLLVRTWVASDACGHRTVAHQNIVVQSSSPPVFWDVPADADVRCPEEAPLPVVRAFEARRANGYCADNADEWDTDICSPEGGDFDRHAFTIPGLAANFRRRHLSLLIAYLNGTAEVTGILEADDGRQFSIDILLSNRVPSEDAQPLPELLTLNAACPFSNTRPSQWKYYGQASGVIKGINGTRGEIRVHIERGTWAQLGQGASGKNSKVGLGLKFDWNNTGVRDIAASGNGGFIAMTASFCNLTQLGPMFDHGNELRVTLTVERQNTSCLGNFTLTRTWSARDNAGKEIHAIQTVTSRDTAAPHLVGLPKSISGVQCRPPPPANVTAFDDCISRIDPRWRPEVTLYEARSNERCPYRYDLERTWSTVDDCGNRREEGQRIRVLDDFPPVIRGVPALDLTGSNKVQCYRIPPVPQVNVSDECSDRSNIRLEYNEEIWDRDRRCPFHYFITRTWTAFDECGNNATETHDIEVDDNEPPVFDRPLPSTYVQAECREPPVPVLTARDNCTGEIQNISFSSYRARGSCDGTFDVLRTWRASDECGNSVEFNQLVSVRDTRRPTFTFVPANVTVDCENGSIPAVEMATATDECSDVNVTYLPGPGSPGFRTDGRCPNEYTLTRVWEACDSCGNCVRAAQVIRVTDRKSPVISPRPADVEAECDRIPCPANVSATDNCNGVELFFTETRFNEDRRCPFSYKLNRTWVAVDACGNRDVHTQIVTVSDSTRPEWVNGTVPPRDETVRCDDVPVAIRLEAVDRCSGRVDVVFNETRHSLGCRNNYELIRRWTARDDCGNVLEHVQKVVVEDRRAPRFVRPPERTEFYECGLEPSSPQTPGTVDDCTDFVNTTVVTVKSNGTCFGQFNLEHTWTARDECDNVNTTSQTWFIRDTLRPFFINFPKDAIAQCHRIPNLPQLGAADSCSPRDRTRVVYESASPLGDQFDVKCRHGYKLNRTWTAIDDCGNRVSQSQTIQVIDDQGPELYPKPNNTRVPCDRVPSPPEVFARDNCNESLRINFTETRRNGTCPNEYTLVRRWYVEDDCGNSDEHVQLVEVFDDKPPRLEGELLPDVDLECDQEVFRPNLTCVDNCGPCEVSFSEKMHEGSCRHSFDLVQTWVARDRCGLTSKHSRRVHVRDTRAPHLEQAPDNTTVECAYIPPFADLHATDNCARNVTVKKHQQRINGSCPNEYTLIRRWFTVDECGNTAQQSQTIHVVDRTPPLINEALLPQDGMNISCDHVDDLKHIVASPKLGLWEECRANGARPNGDRERCFSDPESDHAVSFDTWRDEFVDRDFQFHTEGEGIVRRFTDRQRTRHSLFVYGRLESQKNSAVQFNFELEMDGHVPAGHLPCEVNTTVPDSGHVYCSMSPKRDFTDSGCYEGRDASVNTAHWEYFTHVLRGYLTGVPGTPMEGAIIGLKLRGPALQLGHGANGLNLVRGLSMGTWFELLRQPHDSAFRINTSSWDGRGDVDLDLGYCNRRHQDEDGEGCEFDDTARSNYTDRILQGPCRSSYTIERTFVLRDCSGNEARAVRHINVLDNIAPLMHNIPDNVTHECSNPDIHVAPFIQTSDDCQCPFTAEHFFTGRFPNCINASLTETRQDGGCPGNYSIVRTWTAVDECGNARRASQRIDVRDSTVPRFESRPVFDFAECSAVRPAVRPNVSDNCGQVIDLSLRETRLRGSRCPHEYTLERTWTATDHCGLRSSQSDYLFVNDTKPPRSERLADMCLVAETWDPRYRLEEASRLGVLFSALDDCSGTNLTFQVLSCTSDQDDRFTDGRNDCTYDRASDTLTVRVRAAWCSRNRTFTVLGRAVDECGLATLVERRIVVPANVTVAPPRCHRVTTISDCEGACPCHYNDRYDDFEDSDWSIEHNGKRGMYDSDRDETTFVYSMRPGAESKRPSALIIALDLNRVNVVRYTPENLVNIHETFGFRSGSFAFGLIWEFPRGVVPKEVSYTLKGFYNETMDTPYFLGSRGFSTRFTHGPAGWQSRPTYSRISGAVRIKGPDGVPRNGVSNLIVSLVDDSSSSVAAVTSTDEQGEYTFWGFDASRRALRVSFSGLEQQGLVDLVRPRGGSYSVPASNGGDNNLDLELENYRGDFSGNSRSALWWAYQLDAPTCSQLPKVVLNMVKRNALDYIPSNCPRDLSDLLSGRYGELQQLRAAAAMNHVAGFGILAPKSAIQELRVQFAASLDCDGDVVRASTDTQFLASRQLQYLLSAQ